MKSIIPVCEKYVLSVEEAAQYFRIGEKVLRRMAAEKPTPDWVLMNGVRLQIKRKIFEKYVDMTSSYR